MKYAAILAALAGIATALPSFTEGTVSQRASRRDAMKPRHRTAPNRNITYPSDSSDVSESSNWSGAVQIGTGFNKVVGTIIAPKATGGSSKAASAWVGIDGDTCQTAILQTGISFYGDGSYDAWYEWIPNGSVSFDNFDISEGDSIYMEVDASSKTSGKAILENMTTGQKVTHTFSSPPSSLCETNAEWIVEDFEEDGSLVPLANFGSITFTGASASGSSGTVTPAGATIIYMEQNNKVLSKCATSGNDLTCTYE
ncbi:MAG: hypothetical protein M1818_004086 [Claussenomyces sp. TS43310]|nr:MAG: hypothetical protein M1818_004086 [Claussenomyces sp. TS43310]